MESINRLREYVENASRMSISLMARATLLGMVRDIEQEVGNMVPLPLDADGEAIHVGDVMVYTDGDTCPLPVVALVPPAVFITEEGPRYADMCRHHHAPTVEDVLREFAQEMNENLGMYTGEAIDADEWRKADERTIAEYAAKLRMAGDE